MDSSASTIRVFDRSTIAVSLDAADIPFTDDGVFYRVRIPLSFPTDRPSDNTLMVEGLFSADEPVPKMFVAQFTGALFEQGDLGEAMSMCHEWNQQFHLLTAGLRGSIPHEEGEQGGDRAAIVLRGAVDLSAGVHQAFVDELVIQSGAEAMSFWQDAIAKKTSAITPNGLSR